MIDRPDTLCVDVRQSVIRATGGEMPSDQGTTPVATHEQLAVFRRALPRAAAIGSIETISSSDRIEAITRVVEDALDSVNGDVRPFSAGDQFRRECHLKPTQRIGNHGPRNVVQESFWQDEVVRRTTWGIWPVPEWIPIIESTVKRSGVGPGVGPGRIVRFVLDAGLDLPAKDLVSDPLVDGLLQFGEDATPKQKTTNVSAAASIVKKRVLDPWTLIQLLTATLRRMESPSYGAHFREMFSASMSKRLAV